jgi:hypothetical protein
MMGRATLSSTTWPTPEDLQGRGRSQNNGFGPEGQTLASDPLGASLQRSQQQRRKMFAEVQSAPRAQSRIAVKALGLIHRLTIRPKA